MGAYDKTITSVGHNATTTGRSIEGQNKMTTATAQATVVGTRVCTVGRDGAKCASHSAIFTGKIYEAKQRKDGMLVWSLVGKFGGTRTGKSRPSAKFVAELKAIAQHAWVDAVKQNQACA